MSKTIVAPALPDPNLRLLRFLRYPADGVEIGDPLLELQTGSLVLTVQSPFEGLVLGRHGHINQILKPGTPLIDISTAPGPHPSHKVFVSYRWADTRHAAGRIFERLSREFGRCQVFIDLDALQGGDQLDEKIRFALDKAEVMVVVIGRRWLREAPEAHARIEDVGDRHRREIAEALRRQILIVPVLVDGAQIPDVADLPRDVAGLTHSIGVPISHETWPTRIDEICRPIARQLMLNAARHANRFKSPSDGAKR